MHKMHKMLNRLEAWGCDIPGAMERFVEDEELYLSCLDAVLHDENFQALGEALRERDTARAFDCAHTLKGVLANMGLVPLYDIIVKIVEPLRQEQIDHLQNTYHELLCAQAYLASMVDDEADTL